MHPLTAEFVGTALLMLLGTSVGANISLGRTKGQGAGYLAITVGWGLAVFVGVFVAGASSGAHLNPAVSVALAVAGKFSWSRIPGFVIAQFAGAMTGSALAWMQYHLHFDATDDADAKLGVFCTIPAIRDTFSNVLSEIPATPSPPTML